MICLSPRLVLPLIYCIQRKTISGDTGNATIMLANKSWLNSLPGVSAAEAKVSFSRQQKAALDCFLRQSPEFLLRGWTNELLTTTTSMRGKIVFCRRRKCQARGRSKNHNCLTPTPEEQTQEQAKQFYWALAWCNKKLIVKQQKLSSKREWLKATMKNVPLFWLRSENEKIKSFMHGFEKQHTPTSHGEKTERRMGLPFEEWM